MTTKILVTMVLSDEDVPSDWPHPDDPYDVLASKLFEAAKAAGMTAPYIETLPLPPEVDVDEIGITSSVVDIVCTALPTKAA